MQNTHLLPPVDNILHNLCSKMSVAVKTDPAQYFSFNNRSDRFWCAMNDESCLIKEHLSRINQLGFLTTSSQPAMYDYKRGGVPFSADDCFTHRYQRAYVTGVMHPETYKRMVHALRDTTNVLNIVQNTGLSSRVYSDDLAENDEVLIYRDKTPAEDETFWWGHMCDEIYDDLGLTKEINTDSLYIVMIHDRMPLTPTYSCDAFWEAIISALMPNITGDPNGMLGERERERPKDETFFIKSNQ